MSDDDERTEAECVHCGERIMRLALADQTTQLWLWTHVPIEGPIYLRMECRLYATPAPREGERR
jgi:hypothetical protein